MVASSAEFSHSTPDVAPPQLPNRTTGTSLVAPAHGQTADPPLSSDDPAVFCSETIRHVSVDPEHVGVSHFCTRIRRPSPNRERALPRRRNHPRISPTPRISRGRVPATKTIPNGPRRESHRQIPPTPRKTLRLDFTPAGFPTARLHFHRLRDCHSRRTSYRHGSATAAAVQ